MTNAHTFGSRETERRIAERVAAEYTPEAWREDLARKNEAARLEQQQETAAYEAQLRRDAALQEDQVFAHHVRDTAAQDRYDRARSDVATPGRINFLVAVSAERTPHVDEAAIRAWAVTVPWQVVADKITELKKLPKVAGHPVTAPVDRVPQVDVPEGRYAITGEDGQTVFLKVDRPTEGKWKGYMFVKVQAGSELHRVSRATAATLLRKIAEAGARESSIRYGKELEHCGVCGRELTVKASRDAGIGPVCASKMGW